MKEPKDSKGRGPSDSPQVHNSPYHLASTGNGNMASHWTPPPELPEDVPVLEPDVDAMASQLPQLLS